MSVKVCLMRRAALDLNEHAALQALYPGEELEIVTIRSNDYLQHAALCREHNPDIVILPRERPVPSLAMERGVTHITYTPGGFKRLVTLTPQFEDFKPR